MSIYREIIIDHYSNPRNFGNLEKPDAEATEDNPLCGDKITIQLALTKGKIAEIRFSGHGCAISQAATSLLTEMVAGKSIEYAKKIDQKTIFRTIGGDPGPSRAKCALLGLGCLKAAMEKVK